MYIFYILILCLMLHLKKSKKCIMTADCSVIKFLSHFLSRWEGERVVPVRTCPQDCQERSDIASFQAFPHSFFSAMAKNKAVREVVATRLDS